MEMFSLRCCWRCMVKEAFAFEPVALFRRLVRKLHRDLRLGRIADVRPRLVYALLLFCVVYA